MEQFNLKVWRGANGYSKVKLAVALELSRWTIARLETAGEAPRHIVLACKALEHE